MRPFRGMLACLGTLVLIAVVLITRRRSNQYDGPAAAHSTRSRFRALLAFHTPESLFPPSAIISLTDDNSTFFLARPAAFGTSLPSSGLSGQLWVGGGFEEATHEGGSISTEGELGCGDVPGWPFTGDASGSDGKDGKKAKTGTSFRNPKSPNKIARGVDSFTDSSSQGKYGPAPSVNDGTDDYLHWPLKGAPLSRVATVPEKAQDDGKKEDDKGHADIQSIQETAEIAGKVVLLSRGGCGFLEKTKWVQRRGGVALIVGDNVKGAGLITMYANGDTSNVTIPSIFTSHMSAQLLSSLNPSGGFLGGRPPPSDIGPGKASSTSKKGGKAATKVEEKPAAVKPASSTKTRAAQSISGGSSWLGRLGSLVGLGSDGELSESRRYPNSGRIGWIQSDNWEDDVQSKQGQPSKQQETKQGSNVVKKPQGAGSGGFVIGVHDWRDPDLVALQKEEQEGTSTRSTSTPTTTTTAATAKVYGDSKGKGHSGSNVVPGSGRYFIPDQSKGDKVEDAEMDPEKGKWYKKIFGSEVEELSEEEALGIEDTSNTASAPKLDIPLLPMDDSAGPHDGLWVTITPTTMSASPFFDTLLVLVVSPLVTLTVVYALLLLRSRIQRRRWRAPKSVVERLPVRVYHTMSTTSTSPASQTPSVETSSSAPPLLQSDSASTLTRTRPRSRTTTSVNEVAALTLERQREDLASRYEKKRYRGRQIECAVCLEEYVDGQSQVMSLPCGHEFHAECITPWLTTRRRTCPICKGDVVRSLAAASSADRSASSSPSRASRSVSRARSLDRSGTPHSDTPLLRNGTDDLEGGRGRRPVRTMWRMLPASIQRLWERPRSGPEMADRDR